MNNLIAIRPIGEADCPRILELVQELADFEKAPEEVTVTLEHFAKAGFGDRPVWWGFVALAEGRIIGFALYYIRFSTWKGESMYLEDLLVTESWRRKGVGQLLLDAILTEARAQKFAQVRWQVLEWNEPAIRFYQKNQAVLDPEWVNCTVAL